MTKVTILGQEPKEEKKKPIEFVGYLMTNPTSGINTNILQQDQPNCWDEIVVIQGKLPYKYDIFLCTKKSGEHVMMLGYFNDGVVE